MKDSLHKLFGKAASAAPPFYRWLNGSQVLQAQRVFYRGQIGVVLYYENPPVHQVDTRALEAYRGVLGSIQEEKNLSFLILLSPADPVHAGGDLKETLACLDELASLKINVLDEDALYAWADVRLKTAFAVYKAVRQIAQTMHVVAVLGGGVRYGGSAEIPLWADTIVGDSRSSMCFSEATIGLIPGWGGVGRVITKAGLECAMYMAQTAREISARDLKRIGVYNEVVGLGSHLPQRKDFPSKEIFRTALEEHSFLTIRQLMPRALALAVGPRKSRRNNPPYATLANLDYLAQEVEERSNPANFSLLRGKPLSELDERSRKPLAPQSIRALEELFTLYDPTRWDEEMFIQREMELDAVLYRDPRLAEGIRATLEGRIADFRTIQERGGTSP